MRPAPLGLRRYAFEVLGCGAWRCLCLRGRGGSLRGRFFRLPRGLTLQNPQTGVSAAALDIAARIRWSCSVLVGSSCCRILSNISAAIGLSEGLVVGVMSRRSVSVFVCLRWCIRLYRQLCESLLACRSLSGSGQVGLVTPNPFCRHPRGMRYRFGGSCEPETPVQP
jgi:hypothetical protein